MEGEGRRRGKWVTLCSMGWRDDIAFGFSFNPKDWKNLFNEWESKRLKWVKNLFQSTIQCIIIFLL